MKVLDRGHLYELDTLDRVDGPEERCNQLRFVKRIGDKYPGNQAPGYEGTTTQEVLRALIDRTNYVNAQEWHVENIDVVLALRHALLRLEERAAKVRGDFHELQAAFRRYPAATIETLPTCDACGHIACSKHKDQAP